MPPIIAAFILISATVMLVVSLATDTIPQQGLFGPWHREEHPIAFRRAVTAFAAIGVAGAALLAFSLSGDGG